jgi:hypothetical protein
MEIIYTAWIDLWRIYNKRSCSILHLRLRCVKRARPRGLKQYDRAHTRNRGRIEVDDTMPAAAAKT